MLLKIPNLKLESEANSREHWYKSASRHSMQKMIMKAYLKDSMLKVIDKKDSDTAVFSKIPEKKFEVYFWPVKVIFTRYAPRPYDSDNLQSSFKYLRDSCAEYLTGDNTPGRSDSDPRIDWQYDQKKTKNKEYYVTIEIVSEVKTD